jgi:hypothetical protein
MICLNKTLKKLDDKINVLHQTWEFLRIFATNTHASRQARIRTARGTAPSKYCCAMRRCTQRRSKTQRIILLRSVYVDSICVFELMRVAAQYQGRFARPSPEATSQRCRQDYCKSILRPDRDAHDIPMCLIIYSNLTLICCARRDRQSGNIGYYQFSCDASACYRFRSLGSAKAILQVEQTAPACQGFLWAKLELGQNINLDHFCTHVRITTVRDHIHMKDYHIHEILQIPILLVLENTSKHLAFANTPENSGDMFRAKTVHSRLKNVRPLHINIENRQSI